MTKETVKYEDFDGNEREQDIYFNFTKSEWRDMQFEDSVPMTDRLRDMINNKDQSGLYKFFRDFVLRAYGERTSDSGMFRKYNDNGVRLSLAFSQTAACDAIMSNIMESDEFAAKFFNSLIPKGMDVVDKNVKPEDLGIYTTNLK